MLYYEVIGFIVETIAFFIDSKRLKKIIQQDLTVNIVAQL